MMCANKPGILRKRIWEIRLCFGVLLLIGAFLPGITASAEDTVLQGPASEQQWETILAQSALWMPTDGQEWSYTVTDLDHNGRSEVLCASLQGTGLFTWVNAYELDTDGQTLVPLTAAPYEDTSFPDLIDSDGVCYYDPATGMYHYVFMDYARNGYAEQYASYSAVTLYNGLFSIDYLATEVTLYNADGQGMTSWEDANGMPISEADFLSAPDCVYAGCIKTKVTMDWKSVPQRSVQAEEVSSDGITVHVTKHPTGECLALNGKTWFIAHAENAKDLTWEMISPWGERFTLSEAEARLPGLKLEALEGDTLAVSNAPADLNGWAAAARFTNGNAYATTDPAYIYVGDFVGAYGQVLDGYRNLAVGGEGNSLVEWTDLDTKGVAFGYRLKDLDKDGSPELIVAQRRADGTCGAGDIIYGVYTLLDGQPQEIFHSWARNRYYYTGGSFLNEGSSGALYSDILLLSVSYGRKVIREGIYTDGDRAEIYFRVTGGDRYTGSSTAISEEEFNSALRGYEQYFCAVGQLTAF